VPLLATVVAGNVRLVLTGARVPLVSVYVYASYVVPVGCARVLTFAAVVSLRVGRREQRALLPLSLLLSFELSVVDRDSGVYVRVKRLRVPVSLNKLVLNVVLKPVVKLPLKRVRSLIDPECKLPELQGILNS